MYVYQSQFCFYFNVFEVIFQISTMTSITLSRETDGCKLTTSFDTWISFGDIFHVFPSLKNSTEFLILC